MGLFSKRQEETATCDICGEKEIISQVHYASDGAICKACYRAAGFPGLADAFKAADKPGHDIRPGGREILPHPARRA